MLRDAGNDQPPFTGRSGRAAAREFIRLSVSRENIFHGHGEWRFSGRLFSGVPAAVAKAMARRPGLLSAAGATPGPAGRGRAAPNTPADSGGPAPRGQAAVPGNKPRPVPIRIRAQARGHSKSGGLISPTGEAS